MASPDAFIVVAPVNNTYLSGSKQYDMVFATQVNTQSFMFGYSNVYLCISSNGNIGIGLSNPQTSLQVAGDITPGSNATYNLGNSNNTFKNFYTNSIVFGSSNNVVQLSLDSSNSLQFINMTYSNGIIISSNAANVGSGGGGISTSNLSDVVNAVTSNIINGTSSNLIFITCNNTIYTTEWNYTNGNNVCLMGSNVGIFTTTPLAGLHVNSNMIIEGDVLFKSGLVINSNVSMSNDLIVKGNVSISNIIQMTNSIIKTASVNDDILTYSATNDLIIATSNFSQSILFGCMSTCNILLKINSNGFLGVGKNNPNYALDIVGDLNITGALYQNGATYTGGASNIWSYSNTNVYLLGSNLAIGKSNANYNLDIVGNVNYSGFLYNNGVLVNTSSPGTFSLNPYNPNNVLTQCNVYYLGYVGVMTSNPKAPLHVAGDMQIDGNMTISNAMVISGLRLVQGQTNLTSQGLLVGANSNLSSIGGGYFVLNSNNPYNISPSNVYYLGYVGIAKSNPTTPLDVGGDMNIDGKLSFKNGLSVNGIKLTMGLMQNTSTISATTSNIQGYKIISNSLIISIPSSLGSDSIQFITGSASNTRMTIFGDGGLAIPGNTSIGTTVNSSNKLTVLGNASVTGNLNVTGNVNFTGSLMSNGVAWTPGGGGSSSVTFFNSNATNPSNAGVSNIYYLGYVGIGTSNPQTSFHVQSNATIGQNLIVGSNLNIAGRISFSNGLSLSGLKLTMGTPTNLSSLSGTYSNLIGYSNTSNGLMISIIGGTSNDNIRFVTGSASNNVLVLRGDGNIGIGKSNPGYALDIAGSINFSGGLYSNGIVLGSTYLNTNSSNPNNPGVSNVYYMGYLGVGTSNPKTTLHVNSNIQIDGVISLSNNSTITSYSNNMIYTIPGTTSNDMFMFNSASNNIFNILGNGDLNCYGNMYTTGDILTLSDSNYKTDLKVIPNALEKIKTLTGYTFNMINPLTNNIRPTRKTGLLAQDVMKVIPEAVAYDNSFLNIAYGNLMGLIIEAIKELDGKISKIYPSL
jgi:hypothetical protein